MSRLSSLKAELGILTTNRWTGRGTQKPPHAASHVRTPGLKDGFFALEPIRTDTNSRRDLHKS